MYKQRRHGRRCVREGAQEHRPLPWPAGRRRSWHAAADSAVYADEAQCGRREVVVRALAVWRQRCPLDCPRGDATHRARGRPDRLERHVRHDAGRRRPNADRAGVAEIPATGGVTLRRVHPVRTAGGVDQGLRVGQKGASRNRKTHVAGGVFVLHFTRRHVFRAKLRRLHDRPEATGARQHAASRRCPSAASAAPASASTTAAPAAADAARRPRRAT